MTNPLGEANGQSLEEANGQSENLRESCHCGNKEEAPLTTDPLAAWSYSEDLTGSVIGVDGSSIMPPTHPHPPSPHLPSPSSLAPAPRS